MHEWDLIGVPFHFLCLSCCRNVIKQCGVQLEIWKRIVSSVDRDHLKFNFVGGGSVRVDVERCDLRDGAGAWALIVLRQLSYYVICACVFKELGM